MQVGDILHLEPTLEATSGLDTSTLASITAWVIYIHQAGRYYTVEFRSPITGYNWREAFWPILEPQPKNWRGQPHFKAAGAAV